MLKPIHPDNAIVRVQATLFLAQRFPKPEFILEKISDEKYFSRYQKKTLTKSKRINLNHNDFQVSNEQVTGFVLERFDEKGVVEDIFLLDVNPNKADETKIVIETRSYQNWQLFNDFLFENINNFAKLTQELYLQGFSLNYLDEFNWVSEKLINVDEVFKQESDYLSQSFKKSYNGNIVSVSQLKSDEEGIAVTEERIEIALNNDFKKVQINHVIASVYDDVFVYTDLFRDKLKSQLKTIHSSNKNVLKGILIDGILKY